MTAQRSTRPRSIKILGTLFRDGMQQRGMEISLSNSLKIVRRKAELGWHYAELGFAGANSFADDLIRAALKEDLGQMKVAAFGRTRKASEKTEDCPDIQVILRLGVPVAVIVCKSRLMDVVNSLRISPEENLEMIRDTVSYLKGKGLEVILDLEHALDAWCGRGKFGQDLWKRERAEQQEYFLQVVEAAVSCKADCLVVCDTNGGASPDEVAEIFDHLVGQYPKTCLGIHCHNDNELAVANTRTAVLHGAGHIQGVTNGYGERAGNTNLMSVIPRLQLKDGLALVRPDQLEKFTDFSQQVALAFNRDLAGRAPFVGKNVFSTFAGMHAHSQDRDNGAYLQCKPNETGNMEYIGVNQQSGKANVALMAKKLGIPLDSHQLSKFLSENAQVIEGGGFEISETSFILACHKVRSELQPYFEVVWFKDGTVSTKRGCVGKAEVKVRIGEDLIHEVSEGDGPFDALRNALVKALKPYYPEIVDVRLKSYNLHALGVLEKDSGAVVRLLAEFSIRSNGHSWDTVGVSSDSLEAGKNALVDSFNWFLLKKQCSNCHTKQVA